MTQSDFTRRVFLQGASALAAAAAMGPVGSAFAQEAKTIRFWAPPLARVGGKDWTEMEQQMGGGVKIVHVAKSEAADEALQKMVVGDGNSLFDAITDNGGGMEDALGENKAIVPLDTSKLANWKDILPVYHEGGAAADTIRYQGKVYAVPYVSNADSLAYNAKELGFVPDSWGQIFDPQFKGRVAMQNDFGPTMTTTAIYLKQSGKVDIKNPSDLEPDEIKAVCQFLIDQKKKGQFRTFWHGFQNGVDLLASGEVLMCSCWEPVQIVAARKGADIRYATMKEGHQVWNNLVMFTRGGKERGLEDAFHKFANIYLTPWFGARVLQTWGFEPQMVGVDEYIKANADIFPPAEQERLIEIRKNRAERYAIKGNSWQNVFPKHIETYMDWWSRVQAA